MKGTITLDHTYVAALDQAGTHTFWVIVALENYTVFGANAFNAFAEAPSPKVLLYVTVNKPFLEW